jgi:WD40 repeat protein
MAVQSHRLAGKAIAIALGCGLLAFCLIAVNTHSQGSATEFVLDAKLEHKHPVSSIAFAKSNGRLLSCDASGTVRFWDGSKLSLSCVPSPKVTQFVRATKVANQFWSSDKDSVIRLWDADNGSELRRFSIPLQRIIQSIALSPDDSMLAVACSDATIHLWHLATNAPAVILKGHLDFAWFIDFSPESTHLVSLGSDHKGIIWDVHRHVKQVELQDELFALTGAFTPDGKYLVTAGTERTIRIWKRSDGECVQKIKDFTGIINSVAVSPNGEMLAAAGHARTVFLWDMKTRVRVGTLNDCTSRIRQVQFSPDSKQIEAACDDGYVYVWKKVAP